MHGTIYDLYVSVLTCFFVWFSSHAHAFAHGIVNPTCKWLHWTSSSLSSVGLTFLPNDSCVLREEEGDKGCKKKDVRVKIKFNQIE